MAQKLVRRAGENPIEPYPTESRPNGPHSDVHLAEPDVQLAEEEPAELYLVSRRSRK